MDEGNEELDRCIREAAQWAIRRCAQGLLSLDTVVHWIREALSELDTGQRSKRNLKRIALQCCSSALYEACCSQDEERRNCAFGNLARYLAEVLRWSTYAEFLATHASAADDVLQSTLEELQSKLDPARLLGPDEPASFLQWSKTILIRHAYHFTQQAQRVTTLSLEWQLATPQGEEEAAFVMSQDVEEIVAAQELQQALKDAILSLKNPRYQLVLLGIYFVGMEEQELAALMKTSVQEVYLWKHRALKALRSKREVIEAFRS